MELTDFMKNNPDWEKLLTSPPYCLRIVRDDNYVLFKYDQSKSDMSNPIVQICRGIIVDLETYEVVSRKFDKFFNIEEPLAHKLNGEVIVEEKIDGMLIGMWYDKKKNAWVASTNGNLYLNERVKVQTEDIRTFYDLFVKSFGAREMLGLDLTQYEDYTIIFEMVSPYNDQTVHYSETAIYLLGLRNNKTGEEYDSSILNFKPFSNFKRPKRYNYPSLDAAVRDAKFLVGKEGFVIRDKDFNRVKVKSNWYNEQKFMGVKALNKTNIVKMIWDGEYDDFYAAHPEYKELLDETRQQYNYFYHYLDVWATNYAFLGLPRATLAQQLIDSCPKIGWAIFKMYDAQTTDIGFVLREENLVRIIKTMEALK